MKRPLHIAAALCLSAAATAAQTEAPSAETGPVQAGGNTYANYQEWTLSQAFRAAGSRCKTPTPTAVERALAPPGDCTLGFTNPDPSYDAGPVYRIPVVVHVIQQTNGTGFISQSLVQSQIDILNEDFRAQSGTAGANGVDVGIEFYLATTDPSGNPTNGITYTSNNSWFADSGSYWNSLSWDTDEYLNIYTNDASGALGYVPGLPQSVAGNSNDRVVVYWASFGRNAPIGFPYDQGRTTTHEVGHYLGLYHTFDGGCSGGNCYTGGDVICDTNSESGPEWSCSVGSSSCGSSDPIRNYMNYSYDTCMEEFTTEQARRMRCSLVHYRPDLYELANVDGNYCGAGTTTNGCNASMFISGTPSASATSGFVVGASGVEGDKTGLLFYGISGPRSTPWGSSTSLLCVKAPTQRTPSSNSGGTAGSCNGTISVDWAAYVQTPGKLGVPFSGGATVWAQVWFRDPPSIETTHLSDGYQFTLVP